MRHRVLLGHGHLRERLRRAIRDEDRIDQDGRREPDDLLETVRLNLRIGTIVVDQLDVDLAKLRRDLAELALVRRDEGDQVYRPRDSISFTFAITSSAAFPIVWRYPRSASR